MLQEMTCVKSIIKGLATAAKHMLHPTVLSASDLLQLGMVLTDVWEKHQGHANVQMLFELLQSQLSEHSANVRAHIADRTRAVRPIYELNTTAKVRLETIESESYIRWI